MLQKDKLRPSGLFGDQRAVRCVVPVFAIAMLLFSQLCCSESKPTISIAPMLTPLPRQQPDSGNTLTNVEVESFEENIEGWQGWAEEDVLSEVAWDATGQLLWSVQLQPEKSAALAKGWPALAEADGLTSRLTSYERSAYIVLGVQEADESTYGLVMPLSKQRPAAYSIPFEGMSLLDGSEDENGRLDRDQLATLVLIDIDAYLAQPTPNRIAIDEVVLWEGAVPPTDLSCSAPISDGGISSFRTGVDANYVPQAEAAGRGYFVGEDRVDSLSLFAANGVDSFRVRLWVGDEGESGLDYATELAQRAQKAGLRPYLVIFLSEDWADVNKQPVPEIWSDLSFDERAARIEDYSYRVTNHFRDAGVDIEFYEIGNEIDYGISGVFADTTQARDPDSLREKIWPDEAYLIRAAVAGVREADADARFMLHIATSWDPDFTVDFYKAMAELGVDYDYVGLSLYPSAFGLAAYDRFCETLDRLNGEVGKPVILAETAYPAAPPTGGPFGDWRRALPGYPLTPEGQAYWLADLLAGMRRRKDVVGVYVFGPDFWFSDEIWGPFALFDEEGRVRPAMASFGSDG
jgi:arabinogalactan endo-1,4-beta-galactosidase